MKYYGITGVEASRRAANGDAEALAIWTVFGQHLGQLIKAILFAYDPDAIIIGGGISAAFTFYEASMHASLRDFPYLKTINNLQIKATRQPQISMLGASALVV